MGRRPSTTTAGGYLLVLAIILPVIGILLSLVLGGRHAERIALALMPVGFAVTIGDPDRVWRTGSRCSTSSAAGSRRSASRCAPDGLSAAMMVDGALIVICATGQCSPMANSASRGGLRSARATGVLDAAPGDLGRR